MDRTALERSDIYIFPSERIGTQSRWRKIGKEFRRTFARLSLVAFDLLGIALALFLAYEIRLTVLPKFWPFFPAEAPHPLGHIIWWILSIAIFCFVYEKLYTKRLTFWEETRRLVAAITLAFVLVLAAVSLGKLGDVVSRTALVVAYFISLLVLPLVRYCGKTILWYTGFWSESVLVLGTGEIACKIASSLMKDRYLGYQIFGFLSNDLEPQKELLINNERILVRGNIEDTATVLSKTGIKQVVIALPDLSGQLLVSLTNQIQPYTRSVLVVPDLCGIPVVGGEIAYFFDDQIMGFRTNNNLDSNLNIIIKRLFDLIVGSFCCLLALPFMLVIALIISFDSPGPSIYASTRIGRGGKLFKCYKFRTMYLDNDLILEQYLADNHEAQAEWETFAKLRGNDPRVTRAGRMLRRLSLDELPQIFNVLKGEMSLVGARPYLTREKNLLHEYKNTILLANPGITGLWQVSGRNEIDFENRMKLETWYVRNWSLWLDISLLFRTIPVVIFHRGAY